MTPAQLAALKADIENNATVYDGQTLAQWWAALNPGKIAEYYKQPASPDFYVWKSSLSQDALRTAALDGAAEMDNLEAGKRDALFWMLGGTVNPSLASTRQAFIDLTANRTGGFIATALRNALAAAGKRTATNSEKLFSTGTGSVGSPATMEYENVLSWEDVNKAMAS